MSKAMRAQIKKITSNQNTIVDHGWWCNSLWHAPINSSSFTQNTVRQYTERVIYLNNTLFNIILVQEVFSGITWLMEFEWICLLLCIKCKPPAFRLCVTLTHHPKKSHEEDRKPLSHFFMKNIAVHVTPETFSTLHVRLFHISALILIHKHYREQKGCSRPRCTHNPLQHHRTLFMYVECCVIHSASQFDIYYKLILHRDF